MMKILALVLLLFATGCAGLRPSEPARPEARPHGVEQAPILQQPSAEIVQKEDRQAVKEQAEEPAPPAASDSTAPLQTRQGPSPDPSRTTAHSAVKAKDGPVSDTQLQSLVKLAETNDENILNVFTGMYRGEVERIMGRARNPYKHQKITGSDGKLYDVLFYLTREPRKGRPITDRMLTPVIFRKGQVAAIGNYQLKKLVRTGTLDRKKPVKKTIGPAS